jgi:chromate transport protein ChrA
MPVRKLPAAVITAVVLAVLLALLFGGVVSLFGFIENQQDLAIGGLVIGALLLALAWRLARGGRGAQWAGIAVGAAVIAAGLWQTQGVASLVIFIALGLALILSLTVPASSRAYFRSSREAANSS